MLEVMERLTANRTRPRRIDVDEAREGSGPSDETTTGVATESSVRPGVADEGDWSEGIDFGPPSRGPALPGYRTGSGGDDSEDDWASAADGDELDGQEALFTPGPNEGEPRESAHEEGGSAHEDPEAGQASDRGGDPQEGPRAGAPGGDWGDVTFTDWLGVDQHWDVHQEGKRIADLPGLEEDLADAQATLAEPESPEQTVFEQLAGPAPEAGIETREAPDLAFERPERPPRPDSVPGRTEAGLANKEVWFVATGCEEAGTFGMIEFLKRYGTRLRDAYFINLDNLGSGRLVFVSDEGLMRTHGADPRLLAASRQVADLKNFDIVAHPYHLLTTDATALMARRHRAMSVMALDDRGMLPNWHWMTDTVDRVRVENVESAADFVFELIKNL
jgi:hypothetical protein